MSPRTPPPRLPDSAYQAPPAHVVQVMEAPVDLGTAEARLFWRQHVYRAMVCDFSISVQVPSGTSWVDIYRVDSTHGVVHDHVVDPRGGPERRTICEVIPTENGWDYLTTAFDTHVATLLTSWEHHVRRWKS